MLGTDTHEGLVCGLCYNSISDYVKHSSDLAGKRKRRIVRQTGTVEKNNMTPERPQLACCLLQ